MDNLPENRLLTLAEIAYNKGLYEEAFNALKTLFIYTQSSESMELLLNYFHEPYKKIIYDNYSSNISLFKQLSNCNKCTLNLDTLNEYKILWNDNLDYIYYFHNNALKELSILNCNDEIKDSCLYINILPSRFACIPSNVFSVLYYETDILKIFAQLYNFENILTQKNISIFIDGENILENFIKTTPLFSKIFIGYDSKSLLNRIENFMPNYKYTEKRLICGSLYKKEIFYVIRVRPITSSLGPLLFWVCNKLDFTDKNGYIPVIDFSYFKNVLLEENEIGLINPWEYYFEQPTHFSLQAAYNAQNLIIGNANEENFFYNSIEELIDNKEVFNHVVYLFNKYIHLNKKIEKKVLSIYNQLFMSNWKVLGVVYRGTDYRNRPIVNEHRQPSMEELISKSKELMCLWNCDHIFLATEDVDAISKFKTEFGNILIYTEKERYPSDTVHTQTYHFNRDYDSYLKGEEYLIEICLLSKCNSLLSSRVGILYAVLPMNGGKYENTYIYDLGIHTEEDYL